MNMEIKNLQSRMINTYKKTAGVSAPKKSESTSKATVNADRVEFDFGRYLEAAKADAAAKADTAASAERLAALKEAYSGDNCPVSAEETAASFLA
ncbi:MAG: flagellar biosynthesis anti-sigma factor FlgM [Ruminiclostridium sp.]|nr:flagellar biosynthesis anti-sigma factor FlgM [Ruminiclostridium sp.]